MNHEIPLDAPIFVAGHKGLVGSALIRRLMGVGHRAVLTVDRGELDLRDQLAVRTWMEVQKPSYVIVAAGTVGGIWANSTRPAEFLYDNLMIHANLIDASYRVGVRRLLYLGSSCVYPRDARQPIAEGALLSGPLEPTNEAYAVAKIAGIQMCQSYRGQYGCDFISAMPTNLYGPGDNFDLERAHVLPALMRRFDDAKRSGQTGVVVWGSGRPRREFLHVDDLAEACLYLLRHYDGAEPINVGAGSDLSIAELAELVRDVVHPDATISFDHSKPDGTPRKLLDISRINALGWTAAIPFRSGVESTYEWYRRNRADLNLA